MDEAVDSGFEAIVVTVDAPRGGNRERDLRTGFKIPEGLGVPSVQAALALGAGGDDRGDLRADGPGALLGRRRGPRLRVQPAGPRQGRADRGGRGAGGRARRRRRRRLQPRRPPARPRPRHRRRAARGGRRGRRPRRGAGRRRHPARHRRRDRARARRRRGPRRPAGALGPGGGRRGGRARGSSSCCAPSSSWRCVLCGCASPAELGREHVQRAPATPVYSA